MFRFFILVGIWVILNRMGVGYDRNFVIIRLKRYIIFVIFREICVECGVIIFWYCLIVMIIIVEVEVMVKKYNMNWVNL